jgi:hypothetical protein
LGLEQERHKLRVALEAGERREAARLLLDHRGHEHHTELLDHAIAHDAHVLSPKRLAGWASWGLVGGDSAPNALWWATRGSWSLRVCGVELANQDTLDLEDLQLGWSTVPAREVAEFHDAWASDYAPRARGLAGRVLDLVEQRGDSVSRSRDLTEAMAAFDRAFDGHATLRAEDGNVGDLVMARALGSLYLGSGVVTRRIEHDGRFPLHAPLDVETFLTAAHATIMGVGEGIGLTTVAVCATSAFMAWHKDIRLARGQNQRWSSAWTALVIGEALVGG